MDTNLLFSTENNSQTSLNYGSEDGPVKRDSVAYVSLAERPSCTKGNILLKTGDYSYAVIFFAERGWWHIISDGGCGQGVNNLLHDLGIP